MAESNWLQNFFKNNESAYDSIQANGLGGSDSGLSVAKTGNSSGSALGVAKIGLGIGSFLNARKGLKMQETALNDQLENSNLQRGLAYENLATQVGTRKSLAGAFGANTKGYDDTLSRFNKYKAKGE